MLPTGFASPIARPNEHVAPHAEGAIHSDAQTRKQLASTMEPDRVRTRLRATAPWEKPSPCLPSRRRSVSRNGSDCACLGVRIKGTADCLMRVIFSKHDGIKKHILQWWRGAGDSESCPAMSRAARGARANGWVVRLSGGNRQTRAVPALPWCRPTAAPKYFLPSTADVLPFGPDP